MNFSFHFPMLLWYFLALLLFFHLAWFLLSYYKTRKPLPNEAKIAHFRKINPDIVKLDAVKDSLEERFIEANGFRLHLDILAQGKGYPTVVFIPGTSVYAQNYIGFLAALNQAGFNVVGFDPRGHGRSSGKRGDYTISTVVEDALAVVAYARSRFKAKVAIAGSSQGGIAAFYTAAKDDALAAAVCHNIADLNGKENQILSKIRVPQWLTPVAQFLMGIYGGFVIPISFYLDLTEEYMENGISAADYVSKDPLCVTWIAFRALNSLLKTDLPKPVETITVPVMVVHPEQDGIFPKTYIDSLYKRLTCRKKYYLVKDKPHLVMINDVEEISPTIVAWLRETML